MPVVVVAVVVVTIIIVVIVVVWFFVCFSVFVFLTRVLGIRTQVLTHA